MNVTRMSLFIKLKGPLLSSVFGAGIVLATSGGCGTTDDGTGTGGTATSGGAVGVGGSTTPSTGGVTSGGATSGGASSGGANSGGVTTGGVTSGGASSGGTTSGGAGAGGASGGPTAGATSGGAMTSGGAAGQGGGSAGVSGGGASSNGGSAGASTGGSSGGGAGGKGGSGTGGTTGGTSTGGTSTGGSTGNCMTPPAPPALVGWATNGSGTTGGGNLTPVVVTNAADFSSNISGTAAKVIHLNGSISGSFNVGSNKTIIGVCGAQIKGHVGFNASTNVIFRNLKVVGNNCTDSPSDCSGGADAIGVVGGSNHLWFDHLSVSDGSDGNLDITQGSDFVTVSWTKFSYSSKRSDPEAGASGHRFSNLIGASDTDTRDPGKLNVTWHHNWWADNVDQRMPRTRRGQIHVVNNLFTSSGNSYCTNAGVEAKLLVENNVYIGVNNPLQVASGDMRAVGNVFQSTSGQTTASGNGFTPPYTLTVEATSGLEAAIRSGAGPH